MDKLKPIAEKLGVPLAQLALAWCAARKEITISPEWGTGGLCGTLSSAWGPVLGELLAQLALAWWAARKICLIFPYVGAGGCETRKQSRAERWLDCAKGSTGSGNDALLGTLPGCGGCNPAELSAMRGCKRLLDIMC